MRLYLASVSSRRKQLLKQMGVSFTVLKPSYEEKNESRISPSVLVREHALGKALSVLPKVRQGRILSADSIVYFGGKVLGKPKTPREAFSMLKRLQGRWQWVLTGVAILDVRAGRLIKKTVFVEKTRVRLKSMSPAEIRFYMAQTNPYDKAGGFGIQSKRFPVLSEIRGSMANAVGLPVERLKPFVVNLKPL